MQSNIRARTSAIRSYADTGAQRRARAYNDCSVLSRNAQLILLLLYKKSNVTKKMMNGISQHTSSLTRTLRQINDLVNIRIIDKQNVYNLNVDGVMFVMILDNILNINQKKINKWKVCV